MSDFFATPKIIALQGLGPRDLSGKNTRVNHYFLLQVIFSMSQLGIKLMSPALKVDFFFFFFFNTEPLWTANSKFLSPVFTHNPVQSFSVYPEITCFKMTVLVKRQKQTNKKQIHQFQFWNVSLELGDKNLYFYKLPHATDASDVWEQLN